MRPALALCYDYSTPLEECVRLAREAGFEVVSFGMNVAYAGYTTAEGREKVRRLLADQGVSLDNIHAGNGALASLDEEVHREALGLAIAAVEAAADLGCSLTVHHLSGGGPAPESLPLELDQARRSVETLLGRARGLGVALALENSWRAPYMAVFDKIMAEFDDPLVRFCYDTSHDQLWCDGAMDTLRRLGGRLAVLHVSDNQGKDDDHQLPWEGVIDWERFAAILAETGYTGEMLLEAQVGRSGFKNLAVFTREAYARAQDLIAMVERV